MKRVKKPSISQLKKKADQVFSKWVRNREPYCVTCGGTSNLQAGHFISRSINILRFDPRNVHTQDVRCNVFLNGNMAAYSQFMLRTYGPKIIDNLLIEKQQLHQFTRQELLDIISKYSVV